MSETVIPGVVTAAAHSGGMTRRVQRVLCHRCDATRDTTIKTRLLPKEAVFNMARKAGWEVNKKGKHRCPKCLEEQRMNVKQAARPSETPPREMGALDRRNIFRALDECYDDTNARYCPGYSDAKVAADLKVPRKWIEDMREHNFGPVGTDPEIEKLEAAIARLEADIGKSVSACLDSAAAAEKHHETIAELRATISKIRK